MPVQFSASEHRELDRLIETYEFGDIDHNNLLYAALHQVIYERSTDERVHAVLRAAHIELITPEIWAKGELVPDSEYDINYKTALAIIKQAKEDEIYEKPIPKSEETVIKDAEELLAIAIDTLDSDIESEEAARVVELAKMSTNGDDPEADDLVPDVDSLFLEDYDNLGVREIKDAIDEALDNNAIGKGQIESIIAYETQQADRGNLINFLTERVGLAPNASDEEEVEDDSEESVLEEPFEDYKSLKIPEIKETVEAYLADEEIDADFLEALKEYESVNNARATLIKWLDEQIDALAEGDEGDGTAEPEEQEAVPESQEVFIEGLLANRKSAIVEAVETRLAEMDDENEMSQLLADIWEAEEAGQNRDAVKAFLKNYVDDEAEEETEDSAEEEPEEEDEPAEEPTPTKKLAKKAEKPAPAPDAVEYGDLIEKVTERHDTERLSRPAGAPAEPVEMPFDLRNMSDGEVQALHSAMNAYAALCAYNFSLENALANACKHLARDREDKLLLSLDKKEFTTVRLMEAAVREDEELMLWTERERKHRMIAEDQKNQLDIYRSNVETCSRQWTMRIDERDNSGQLGKRGSR